MTFTRILGYLTLVPACAFSAVYEVGPGKPLATIGAVPWAALTAGDTVRIHYRSEPYREKWAICRQGTAAAPITITGVPGTNGDLPVIDGSGARTAPGLNFWNDERGVVKVGGCNTPADTMPRHIVIENLEIRNARTTHTFTDDGGTVRAYTKNAAVLYVEKCENCTIRNNVLHDAGNVIFVSSPRTTPSREIVIQGNRIYSGGNSGSAYEHNIYTAAIGITVEGNHFGRLLSGAAGNNVKDRSSGTVVRYNWIDGGNRQLDLVDGEDTELIRDDARYRETHVYGNVLIERAGDGNRQIVHYGGDSANTAGYRQGTLHFYNNTIVSYRTDRNTFFRLSTNAETADVRNNIFYTTLAGSLTSLLDQSGVLRVGRNWIKPGWRGSYSISNPLIQDESTWVYGTAPGFVDEAGQDFHLTAESGAADGGGNLNPAVLPANDVIRQYVKHQATELRPDAGLLDCGAFERGGAANQPPAAAMSLSAVTGTAPLKVNGSAAGSYDPDGSVASYQWNFGDGGTASGVNVTHTFTRTGTFTVTLDVTDNMGAKASRTMTVAVSGTAVQPPGTPVLTGTASGYAITLSWTTPSSGGAPAGYRIQQRIREQWTTIATVSGTSQTIQARYGLWTFRVQAFNSADDSPWSNTVSLDLRRY